MNNALPRFLWAWMLLLLLACHARAQNQFKPVPPLRTRVTDEVGMLTPDQRRQLESSLSDYEIRRGVQGVLTDAQSKRILEDRIAPYFRRQDWYGGLHAGADAIEVLLDQEPFAAPRRHTGSEVAGYIALAFFALAGIIVIIVAFIVIRAARRFRRKARPVRTEKRDKDWDDSTPAFAFSSNDNSSSSDCSSSSDVSGDGGTFDGGGASGDWDD